MTEKQKIERVTADAFVPLYNAEHGTDYAIKEYSDGPDIRCVDSKGNKFNFEITLTEDRPGDIQAILDRSEDRSVEALEAHLKRVEAGLEDPLAYVSRLDSNVTDILVQRVVAKKNMRYGPNVALVVRDTSGVDWDWDLDMVGEKIKQRLPESENPYDKGIWVISTVKDRIFRLV